MDNLFNCIEYWIIYYNLFIYTSLNIILANKPKIRPYLYYLSFFILFRAYNIGNECKMFKRKKSYEELRATLFDTNVEAKEREGILLSLLNDPAEEATKIFIDYLKNDSEKTPINPVFNYRGEYVSGIKALLISKIARDKTPQTKNLLFFLLGKYYLFTEMRNSLINTIGSEFSAKEQAISIIFTQASQEKIPIYIYLDLLNEYLKQLREKSKVTYLTGIILSPDFVSSDFPTKFNLSVLKHFMDLKSEKEAIFNLVQTMADKCTRPNKNYYQKDYLLPYHEAMRLINEKIDLLDQHERKNDLINYFRKILASVSQSEDEQFLLGYNEEKIASDRFISYWHYSIDTRAKLRKEILNILVFMKDDESQHEMTLLEFQKKYTNLDEIKNVYKEIGDITDLSDLQNINEFIFKLEILLEILEWSFIEILENLDYTKFDIIKAILQRVNVLVQKQHPDAKMQHIFDLLKTTTDEAVNQYLFRQSVVQKIIKSEEFLLKLQQREVKYAKMEIEPIHLVNMKFKNVMDLAEKQKKLFNQLIGNFNSELIMDLLQKLNDVVLRIGSLPHYYVMFKPRLRIYNANYAKKETRLVVEDLQDRLAIFYRNIDAMISATLKLQFSMISYRRID